jgi:hypothetical protein
MCNDRFDASEKATSKNDFKAQAKSKDLNSQPS